ncbi:MAG: site-specific integrase [Lachnospiraceae bacterium]|jgi:integrase|nr:site-specific integrase [Lachnospiraceae bacterium]
MASIRKRNDKFAVVLTMKDSRTGKWKQKWITCDTYAEAKKKASEIEFKKANGLLAPPSVMTVGDLVTEYINMYGKEHWSVKTYERNRHLIQKYIIPLMGNAKLEQINVRYLEYFYKQLQTQNWNESEDGSEKKVAPTVVRDIQKLLKSVFHQAMKWQLMDRNPAEGVDLPKYKSKEREVWSPETMMYANQVCKDEKLKLAINLTFAASLRIGEALGLTWDCVDISDEAVAENRACIRIEKELLRVSVGAVEALEGKDIIKVFPPRFRKAEDSATELVLKAPKTESSIRSVYIPPTVVAMLKAQRKRQNEIREMFDGDYHDYNLVLCQDFGDPMERRQLANALDKLIRQHDLPPVTLHSFRHASITYKLKLSGGNIKAVQGDSGHAQAKMVLDLYSHIMDEDRKRNAKRLEEAFYQKKDLDPEIEEETFDAKMKAEQKMTPLQTAAPEAQTKAAAAATPSATSIAAALSTTLPSATTTVESSGSGPDAAAIARVLSNPQMMSILAAMSKAMSTDS